MTILSEIYLRKGQYLSICGLALLQVCDSPDFSNVSRIKEVDFVGCVLCDQCQRVSVCQRPYKRLSNVLLQVKCCSITVHHSIQCDGFTLFLKLRRILDISASNCEEMGDSVSIDSDSFDSVDFLVNNSVEVLSFEQKVQLKGKIGRPKLNISQKDGKYTRTFQEKWYTKYRWLAGNKVKQTYHCFYCLMFGGEESWCKEGQTTLKNFELKASKHATSKLHIQNAETFHMLGRFRIDHCISESARIQAEKHNENVARNRKIVGRLIDVVCHLGKQEQSFRGHDESVDSLNKGNYLETLSLLAMEEGIMKDHLESNSVFKGTSSEVQNDLIESVTVAINEKIRKEINEAKFVSIQADETTDVSTKAQLSIIVRYVNDKNTEERFMGFYDVSSDKSAEGISNKIFAVIEEYNMGDKLICQTYDGASVMAGRHGGVQAIVRRKYPNAIFVHCYAHQLNLVLLHSAKTIKEVKLFICNLTAFHSFFSRSACRSEVLRQRGFQLPHPVQTRWNYNSRAVSTIKHHYQELRSAVSFVIESDDWDPESVNCAIGLLRILDSLTFTFLLSFFNRIFIFSEHLFNIFQAKCTNDVNLCINEIRIAKTNISSLRSEKVLHECLEECMELNKNCVVTDFNRENFVENHKRCAFEIVDSIVVQLDERFSKFDELSFVELLNYRKFTQFKKSFPNVEFQKLKKVYSAVFNFPALHNELVNIYSSEDKAKPCSELLAYIIDNDLQTVYEQTEKLLKLILCIPMSSATTERSMSTLKRIKTHLRNSMSNNRLSNLATISIEKELSRKCSQDTAFKERVIDIFSEMKSRRFELIYKKI